MAVLYKSDLEASNSQVASFSLESEVRSINSMINAINTFISESETKLIGKSWDLVRTKLTDYVNALELGSKIAMTLGDNIRKADNSLMSYMENYSIISTDYLDDLLENRARCERHITQLESMLSLIYSKEGSLPDGNETGLRTSIRYYKNKLLEINDFIEKIEGLNIADKEAMGQIADSVSDTANYKAQVESKKASSMVATR